MDENDEKDLKPKKKIPVLSIISLIVGVGAVTLSTLSLVELSDVNANAQGKLNLLNKRVASNTEQIDKKSSPEQSEEKMATAYKKVIDDVGLIIAGKIEKNNLTIKEEFTNQIASQLEGFSLGADFDEKDIAKVVDKKLYAFNEQYARDKANQTRSIVNKISQFQKIQNAHERRFNEIDNALSSHSKVNVPKEKAVNLRRLKSFNILSSLKDDTVFVIEAPKKDGKINTITLTVGEAFYSAYGSHKVLSSEMNPTTGKAKLIISGNWFIDEVREELTNKEINAIKASKQARKKKAKEKKVKKVVAKHQEVKKDFSKMEEMASNKIILKDWFVITTVPERKEVVVYSPKVSGAVKLTKNKYVEGIGTVRDINLTTGETCFEKYCVAGLK